ncbi:MAG: hypothetical protein H6658_07545 [Ardenticatenaceae bacterium]|nr:hypothetical protein [Anaerolineales bacterium]MCB8943593.1 hypothetical protein [Ardenticatenaceae bacterium]
MGFLKKIFGGGERKQAYADTHGLYFYAVCDNCGAKVKVRADKQHDLNRTDSGFVWHKTIVDNRCFRRMQAVVYLNGRYEMTNYEMTGGRFISQEEYERVVETADPDAAAEDNNPEPEK